MKRLRVILCGVVVILVAPAIVSARGQQASSAVDTSRFVEITHHVMGDAPANNSVELVQAEWNKIMGEQINAHMILQWIEWADWYTKYNLLLASGQPVDLIHTSSTWLDMWANAQRGAFLPLDDLAPTYAPKTWAEIPAEDWEQITFDGRIIGFPENDYTQYVNHGMFYRGDWAREFGIREPITSLEQLAVYYEGIASYKQGVVPWDANGSHIGLLQAYFETKTDVVRIDHPLRHRIFFGESWENPYEIVSIIFDDRFIQYAEMMKQWYDRGYWRRDVLNFTGDTRANMRAGRSGSDQHHTQTYRGLRYEMDRDQPGSDLQFFAWSDTRGNLVAEPITHGATSIGRNSRNPERAVMAYEMIRQNKEVYQLLNYGIEGVQYEIQNNVRVRPVGYTEADHQYYGNFWGGRVDRFEIPINTEWPGIYDLWAEYDQIVRSPYPFGRFILDRTSVEAEFAAISDVLEQMLVPINYGIVDNPGRAVADLRNALLAAGHDRVLAVVQSQVDDYVRRLGL